jgi:predicted flap endonuclease-1-like 5' DNA nuclease
MLAAFTWDIWQWIAAFVAFLVGWFLSYFLGGKFGKKREDVLRRVVETSTDESTRIRTLSDEHAMSLKAKDDALLRIKGDQENELLALRADRDKALTLVKEREVELTTHKAEATKLQGLVGTVDTSKKELDDLRAQLTKQKADYELTLGDWRKRAEAGEAAKVAAEKRAVDFEGRIKTIEADHAKVVGDWQGRVKAAESKSTEVQGLLGSTKADNDKALAEWRLRAEKAEASVAAGSKATADWEAKYKALEADRAKVAADWQARVQKLEADHATVVGDWQGRVKAAESKSTEVQGLLGSTKADNDKALAEWRLRAEKAEASVAAGSKATADWEAKYKALEADRAKIAADWEAKYKASEADRAKVAADWQARAQKLEADHASALGEWQNRVKAAEAKSTEVQGLLGSTKADNDKALAEWRLRAEKAEASVAAGSKATADWETRYKALEADRAKVAADWEARYKAAEGKQSEIQGLLSNAQSDNQRVVTDWTGRFNALQSDRDNGFGQRDAEIARLRGELAEATAGPDDLLIIEGIGPKINQALRADGITRWVQVRDASQDRLRSAIEKAGITFAPSMTTWPKQARYLAAGDQAGFRQYTEYLISGQDPEAYGGEEVTGEARVQALAGGDVYGSGNVEKAEQHKNSDGSDNLLIIEGIGPKFNEALLKAGINTFAKVAGSSEDQLRNAIQAAGLSFAPSLATWAEQAGLLARGDLAGFEALAARLVAGRHDG